MSYIKQISFILLVSFFIIPAAQDAAAQSGRWEQELSGDGWKLWLDRYADWTNDTLYLPPVTVSTIPAIPPTCGWENLDASYHKKVTVPGTVEEHFWSANGNPNGTAGDYRGVSWWSRTFRLDPSLKGKRIILAFDSVNLRAEVFLNRKLVGYDVIGNTPFEVPISDVVAFNGENRLDIRITDPVGTFDWNDENLLRWGDNGVPSVHGFGGITGRIIIRATDDIYVDDIYVQNKPNIKNADIYVTIDNSSEQSHKGDVTLVIHEWKHPDSILYKKTRTVNVPADGNGIVFNIKAPKAKPWGIKDPNLYIAHVTFNSEDGSVSDSMSRRFGFRFFTVGEKDGDKRFYLNGKRVFILAAMTRGFWPKNGIFPTPEMAVRDMETCLALGHNMMLYHRAIGQPLSIETADEMGVLTYEEPGGYLCRPQPTDFAKQWRREKLRRMVIRDRSHPSMVIFNIDDLSNHDPNEDDEKNIRMVHELDPSRPVTYNCITSPTIPNERDNPLKLHMLPYDDTFYYHGWTSPYHLVRYGGYLDEYYRNPRYYLRYVIDPVATMGDSIHPLPKDEIIFLGEEGAIGAMVRLEKIRDELMRSGSDGWREQEHLDWYDSYERFLDESGFRTAYPSVDNLTMAMGNVMHYFHGRIIENVRISNKGDAYVTNGWASAGTRTDFVDAYRNPTGDPSILQHYTQPLYVAVKIRDKVLSAGSVPVADIYIVNENNLKGNYTLDLVFEDPDGKSILTKSFPVNIIGGEDFGQLLVEEFIMPPVEKNGYYKLLAEIRDKKGGVKATGYDDIYSVDFMNGRGIVGKTAVIDTSGVVNGFLKEARGVTIDDFDPSCPYLDCIIIGAHDFNKTRFIGRESNTRVLYPIFERVANGTTLIVLDQADRWAQHLGISLKYIGSEHWGNKGRFFMGKHAYFQDLPMNCAMNWEYQAFYHGDVWGLRLAPQGVETIIGVGAEHKDYFLNALCRIPFGEGEIILTTLRILPELGSDWPQSAVAKKLFLNILECVK